MHEAPDRLSEARVTKQVEKLVRDQQFLAHLSQFLNRGCQLVAEGKTIYLHHAIDPFDGAHVFIAGYGRDYQAVIRNSKLFKVQVQQHNRNVSAAARVNGVGVNGSGGVGMNGGGNRHSSKMGGGGSGDNIGGGGRVGSRRSFCAGG